MLIIFLPINFFAPEFILAEMVADGIHVPNPGLSGY
jgi:hypothetical protein